MEQYSIALVTTPWLSLAYPSIQLGVLTPVLRSAGMTVKPFSLHVDWMVCIREASAPGAPLITVDESEYIASETRDTGLGDWIFSDFDNPRVQESSAYCAALRTKGVPERIVEKAGRLRAIVAPAIARWADAILAGQPAIVGFSTTFSQNLASAALTTALKRRAPDLRIVWGGSNCDGTMGEALMRIFPDIDVTVQGEGEHAAVEVCSALLASQPLDAIPSICYRQIDSGDVIANTATRPPVRMEDVPVPDYEEYFTRLERTDLWGDLFHRVSIPFETSRGCWWGAKSHCTFCGLNRDTMAFRSKAPETVVAELVSLSARHKLDRFAAVDNIIDWRYAKSVLPELRNRGYDWTLFYETKANLKRAQIELYADAGIRVIQPGIESLSTSILKLMRKGVTALQNIALLKWCAAYGIRVNWNIIIGTPGESPEDYREMAALAGSLSHLQPPAVSPLGLDRFSPYHQNPQAWGLSITGPKSFYRQLYTADDHDLMDLAYSFDFTYDDGRKPEEYSAPLRVAIAKWQERFPDATGQLRYFSGPGFLRLRDYRTPGAPEEVVLDETEGHLYLSCDEGASAEQAREALPQRLRVGRSIESVYSFFDEMVGLKLMYQEAGRYLGLALPSEARRRGNVRGE